MLYVIRALAINGKLLKVLFDIALYCSYLSLIPKRKEKRKGF